MLDVKHYVYFIKIINCVTSMIYYQWFVVTYHWKGYSEGKPITLNVIFSIYESLLVSFVYSSKSSWNQRWNHFISLGCSMTTLQIMHGGPVYHRARNILSPDVSTGFFNFQRSLLLSQFSEIHKYSNRSGTSPHIYQPIGTLKTQSLTPHSPKWISDFFPSHLIPHLFKSILPFSLYCRWQ